MSVVIAIDGPTAAGKGTLARRLAAHLGFDYLDTGGLYRAVGARALAAQAAPDEATLIAAAQALGAADLQRPNLRDEIVGRYASICAAIPAVRAALLTYQRRFAGQPPGGKGAVLDGRDIGTVICPDAPVKLYVTASAEIRAQRRTKELQDKGEAAIYARVLQELRDRDHRDQTRAVAPLKPAEDAVVLDTTGLDAEQAFQAALVLIKTGLSAKSKA